MKKHNLGMALYVAGIDVPCEVIDLLHEHMQECEAIDALEIRLARKRAALREIQDSLKGRMAPPMACLACGTD